VIDFLETEEDGAVFMAYLSEIKPRGKTLDMLDDAYIIHDDYQLALKRKILDIEK